MLNKIDLRDCSKKVWLGEGTIPEINAGSFQRIADALELMSKNYANLIYERDRAKDRAVYLGGQVSRLAHSNAALRGYIGRLKKRAG